MKHYYISNNDQPEGPFTLDELAGRGLKPNTMIWHDEMPDWRPASVVASVQSLLPKLPPPLRKAPPPLIQGSTINDTSATNDTSAPLRAAPSIANSKAQGPAGNKKKWVVGGGIGVLSLLLLVGIIHGNNTSSASAYATPVTELGENNQSSEINASAIQAAQQQRAAEEARQAAAARETKRAWNRKHFLEYVDTEILPGYTYRLIGGVSNGYFRFTNKSGYRLQNIVIDIAYIKSDGEIYTTKQVAVGGLAAHSSATTEFPSCGRGVRVTASTNHLEAPGLEYVYDAQGEADAMTAAADARIAEQGGY
jgi:hypothetical protein